MSTFFGYKTASSLPCDSCKNGFLILFQFRNKHLFDMNPIMLCYKGASRTTDDL